jgi:chromosome segregation ATPase
MDDDYSAAGANLQAMSAGELAQTLETLTKLKEKHSTELARAEQQFASLQQAYQNLSKQAQATQGSLQSSS